MVNLKGSAGKWLLVTYSYSHGIRMEGLRETIKNLRLLVWHLESPEHGSHFVLLSNILHFFLRLDC